MTISLSFVKARHRRSEPDMVAYAPDLSAEQVLWQAGLQRRSAPDGQEGFLHHWHRDFYYKPHLNSMIKNWLFDQGRGAFTRTSQ